MKLKLIDILVRELPKRGGWPDGAVECQRFVDGATIDFYDKEGNWSIDCASEYGAIAVKLVRESVVPCEFERVTFDEYETALAATKGPKMNWKYIKGSEKDFVGAPESALMLTIDSHKRKHFTECIPTPGENYYGVHGGSGVWGDGIRNMTFEIIAQREPVAEWVDGLPPVGCEVEIEDKDGLLIYGHDESGEVIAHVENTAVVRMSYGLGCFESRFLRPLRTEADKKRDEAIDALQEWIPDGGWHFNDVCKLYGAIAAGKIPGVKLED